jgi:hypothetical protein
MATGRIPTTANSPLTVKGDLFGYSTTQARVPVGNDGETLVADSSTATGLRYGANFAAGKNMLLNADMQIAQRGTSFTGITSSTSFLVDRYNFEPSSLGTWTATQENDAPSVLGNAKSAKVLCTTANASPGTSAYAVFQTALEGQSVQRLAKGTASAQTSTMSFWVKSNKIGTYTFTIYDAINARAVSVAYTISASATWEKKIIVIPADATGSITNNNAVGIRIYWNLAGGSSYTSGSQLTSWGGFTFGNNWMPGQVNLGDATNNYWQITGIQWEIGPVATAFQTATGTIQGELAACQRYYVRFDGTDDVISNGSIYNSTSAYSVLQYPVEMRSAPSISASNTNAVVIYANGGSATATNNAFAEIGTKTARWQITASGLTGGNACWIQFNASGKFLEISAEL